MKPLCVLVVSILVSGARLEGQTAHVRPLDSASSTAYARGLRQSDTFRALVAELSVSDLIVHIVTATGLPGDVAGTTRLAGRRGGWRYVRIDLAASLIGKARVSILAHELQHACEIARSGAESSVSLGALYRVIGTPTARNPASFDTAEALAAGRTVWAEMSGRHPPASAGEQVLRSP